MAGRWQKSAAPILTFYRVHGAMHGTDDPDPVRLLLVEDHADTLEVLAMTLSEHFAVVACRSPAEALPALQTGRVDVVVLDIGMAPMDGLECLQAIRGLSGYESIPAIAVTAFARDVERCRFLAAGFQAVITKPVDDGELLAAIGTVLDADARPRRHA